jgi:hypothetical protein
MAVNAQADAPRVYVVTRSREASPSDKPERTQHRPLPPIQGNDMNESKQAWMSDRFHLMNGALCDFGMRWRLDGDYLRCRGCNRPQLTDYAHEDFMHAASCRNASKSEPRPWETLIHLLEQMIATRASASLAKELSRE